LKLNKGLQNRIRKTEEQIKKTNASSTSASASSATLTTEEVIEVHAILDPDPEVIEVHSTAPYQLRDSVIIDSGSTINICNNIDRFVTYEPISDMKPIFNSKGLSYPLGKGTMRVPAARTDGKQSTLHIYKALYIPGYSTNIVSCRRLAAAGLFHNFETPDRLVNRGGKLSYNLLDRHSQYCLKYNTVSQATFTTAVTEAEERTRINAVRAPSRLPKPVSKAESELWHDRIGHVRKETLEHLEESCIGVKVMGLTTVEYVHYAMAKAQRIVSRRPSAYIQTMPFEKVHIDFFAMKSAYNNMKTVMVIKCRMTKICLYRMTAGRKGALKALENLEAFLWRQYGIIVRCIRTDFDSSLLREFEEWCFDKGIILERSSIYTPQQNPQSEKIGGDVFEKTRALQSQSQFPYDLWPELVAAAIYLINRTPRKQLNWTTPEGSFNDWLNNNRAQARPLQPSLAHLRRYGCRAYPVTTAYLQGTQKSEKQAPRAHIGYLCGYDSTNIYRVWVPALNKVLRTRDVTFNEDVTYDPRTEDHSVRAIQELGNQFNSIDIPEPTLIQEVDIAPNLGYLDLQQILEGPGFETAAAALQQAKESQGPDENSALEDSASARGVTPSKSIATDSDRIILGTPIRDRSPERPERGATVNEDAVQQPQSQEADDDEDGNQLEVKAQQEAAESRAPEPQGRKTRSADLDLANIVDRPRTRRPRQRYEEPDAAFHTAFNEGSLISLRLHQNTLPPPPKNWKEMSRHRFSSQWHDAAVQEINTVRDRGTYVKVRLCDIDLKQHRVLPLTWVFTYKYDSQGYLTRFKARLCVRGDLQPTNSLETYASTLTARSLRTLLAIAARFNLQTRQLDAVNAFTNSQLDEVIYTDHPPGFSKSGTCLQLIMALYGLRRSPYLWQHELSTTLKSFGLEPIPEDDCIFISKTIVLFVYVDDIVLMFRDQDSDEAENLITKLKDTYDTRDLGEMNQFLNLRILRDRQARKLWVCQDTYISKIAGQFNLNNDRSRAPQSPMQIDNLCPYEGTATADQIHLYQRKVGSINYAAVITRPDISRAAGKLAEFMLNPGPEHHQAVDQVIRYLYGSRYYALEYNGETPKHGLLTCSSDAAFADDPQHRTSSQGYVMTLFNGPIAWKASKQRSVVTSSTEAELVALTQATREYMSAIRLVEQLQLDLGRNYTLLYDNQQTLRLMTSEQPQLTSKLRHINIQGL
jgi:hypothetical protein